MCSIWTVSGRRSLFWFRIDILFPFGWKIFRRICTSFAVVPLDEKMSTTKAFSVKGWVGSALAGNFWSALAEKSRLIDFSKPVSAATFLIRARFVSLLGFERNVCRPFIVCGQQVGLIRPDVMSELMKYPEVFFIRDVAKSDNSLEVCLLALN